MQTNNLVSIFIIIICPATFFRPAIDNICLPSRCGHIFSFGFSSGVALCLPCLLRFSNFHLFWLGGFCISRIFLWILMGYLFKVPFCIKFKIFPINGKRSLLAPHPRLLIEKICFSIYSLPARHNMSISAEKICMSVNFAKPCSLLPVTIQICPVSFFKVPYPLIYFCYLGYAFLII